MQFRKDIPEKGGNLCKGTEAWAASSWIVPCAWIAAGDSAGKKVGIQGALRSERRQQEPGQDCLTGKWQDHMKDYMG